MVDDEKSKFNRKNIVAENVDKFLEFSTSHGLYYIKSDNPLVVRLFWAIVTFIGVAVTIFQLHNLKNDWAQNQVITTILSAAAPVTNLTFPAVTICPERIPIDNWGYVRKVSAIFKFECYSKSKNFPHCNETKKLREDFKPFLDFIVDLYYEDLDRISPVDIDQTLKRYKVKEKHIQITSELVQMKLINDSVATDFMKDNLATYRRYENALEFLEELLEPLEYKNLDAYDEDTVIQAKKYIFKLLTILQRSGNIGHLITHFAPLLSGGQSFRKTNNHRPSRHLKCRKLSDMEIFLHNFFSNLSSVLDIGHEANKISLFELPSFIELPNENQLSRPNARDVAMFTACVQNISKNSLNWRTGCGKLLFIYLFEDEKVETGPKGCYPFGQFLGVELTNIMTVMKHAIHRGLSSENTLKLFQPFMEAWNDNNRASPPYPINDQKKAHYALALDTSGEYSSSRDLFSMIPFCQKSESLVGQKVRNAGCHKFQAVSTNKGICYAYNAMPTLETLQPSPFTESFSKAFEDEIFTHVQFEKSKGADENHGLTIYLDRQIYHGSDFWTAPELDWGMFRIGINDMFNAFSMRTSTVNVRVGYKTTIMIQVEELTASDDLRTMPLDIRNCRFKEETTENTTFFNFYTQASCEFECLLKKARNICNCTPWSFPFAHEDGISICESNGFYCFDIVIRSRFDMESCNCLPDCESLTFTLSTLEEPLNVEDECGIGKSLYRHAMKKQTLSFNEFLHGFQVAHYNRTGENIFMRNPEERMKICQKMIKTDIALVNIRMQKETYLKSKQLLRLQLADKVASVGGTLGLFTGMSFLSLVEIVFWIIKGCHNSFRGVKKRNEVSSK